MSLYAEIKNNLVINIIVADQNFINASNGNYVEYTLETPILGYAASIGFAYDDVKKIFIAPKCHDEAILDEANCRWSCANATHDAYIL